MGAKTFTKDEVEILLTHTALFYNVCINDDPKKFIGQTKYEIIKEILRVIEKNEKKKPRLSIVKGI